LKAELELSQSDGAERALADLHEALSLLRAVEVAALGIVAVLVVDDDERLAELTARALRRLGYEAESAGTLRELRPNEIVVFDLGLASALDKSTRSALTRSRPIVVTGSADPGSRGLAARLEASDYLVKPVELDDLVAAISRRIAAGIQP
jgi:DNA-binding response OmpR family regulator